MAHVSLVATSRTVTGNSVRKLRNLGIIPAVIYSNQLKSRNLELVLGQFLKAFKESGKTHVIDLQIDGKETLPCIVHILDVDPVKGTVRHVDFLSVNLNEKVIASVPLVYIGESKAVKESGGILNTTLKELEVEALPDNIPSQIEVDITVLESFDDVIRVSSLNKSSDYSIIDDGDLVVASITSQSVEKEEVAEVVAEAPAITETKEK